MVNTINGFSKSIDLSFKYAREDLGSLKMKSSFIEEKINELRKVDKNVKADLSELRKLVRSRSKQTITLIPKKTVVSKIKKEFSKDFKKPKSKQGPELQFYDVKARKRFSSKVYREVVKNKTLFAVAKSPHGNYECYRILKKV